MRVISLFLLLVFSTASVCSEQEAKAFEAYIDTLKSDAQLKGFSADFLEDVFDDITFRPSVVKSDKNQPEKKITLDDYLSTRVPDWKVEQAVTHLNEHKTLLTEIGQKYGVQPRFIVALWGNESNFGRIQGSHSVLSALASLAFEGRREALFKKNFFAALTILREGHTTVDKLKGSWAGAMGQSQFMPVSFLNYAVDYDGDGKKDIWNNPADVFASIANYLSSEGWDENGTWGRQVLLTSPIAEYGLAKKAYKPLSHWHDNGVTRYNGAPLPNANISASLIMPDGEKGRIYLVYNNFHTLMKWNRSQYFGVSVGYLSERIKRGY